MENRAVFLDAVPETDLMVQTDLRSAARALDHEFNFLVVFSHNAFPVNETVHTIKNVLVSDKSCNAHFLGFLECLRNPGIAQRHETLNLATIGTYINAQIVAVIGQTRNVRHIAVMFQFAECGKAQIRTLRTHGQDSLTAALADWFITDHRQKSFSSFSAMKTGKA